MVDAFSHTMLDSIVEQIEADNRIPEGSQSAAEDHAIMEAVRVSIANANANVIRYRDRLLLTPHCDCMLRQTSLRF
jgi:hypothetical protein